MALGRKKAKTEQEDATARILLASELATLRTVMQRYPTGSKLSFGSPSRCPECGDYGIVRTADHARGTCDNYCRVCQRSWIITARALQAFYLESAEPTAEPVDALTTPDGEGPVTPEPQAIESHDVESHDVESHDVESHDVESHDVESHDVESHDVELPDGHAAPVHPAEPVVVAAAPASAPASEAEASPGDAAPAPTPDDVAVDLTEPLPTLRILVVDDNPFDFAMIEELLEPFVASGEIDLEHRATRRQGEEAARSFPFDVVLLDLDLHDTTGLTTVLEWNHRAGESLPLIALIDEADADLTQQTSSAGILAVIHKAHLEKLTTQGDAGQKRLHKLLRDTAAKAVDAPEDRRWSRLRSRENTPRPTKLAPNEAQ